MRTIIVTGSAGLIGSETVKRFAADGMRVVGIDNDMRAEFFGPEASTKKIRDDLIANVRLYEHHALDARDRTRVRCAAGIPASSLQSRAGSKPNSAPVPPRPARPQRPLFSFSALSFPKIASRAVAA
jgi:CDP-paratose 2-epimerase